jgi:hypothetical protein
VILSARLIKHHGMGTLLGVEVQFSATVAIRMYFEVHRKIIIRVRVLRLRACVGMLRHRKTLTRLILLVMLVVFYY